MTQKNLALVLGGGGAVGHAWLIGVVAGLADAGADLTAAADQVIGTSAGATAAAWVRSGAPPAELLATILSEPARPGAQHRPPPPAIPIETVFERMRAIGAAASSADDLCRAMGAFALESDPELGPEASDRWRAIVAARLPSPEWPEKPMIATAVDAHSGELAAFDRNSGVALADAVAASTAAPGLVPTQDINRRRYVDGGVRSVENADLACGYANVVVLSPLGGRRRTEPGQFEGLRREPEWRTTVESQVAYLRDQGSRVELITPDADSVAAMGANLMDFTARIPAARAGFDQGRHEAARITFV